MVECPVCGALIDVDGNPDYTVYNGSNIVVEWFTLCECGTWLTVQKNFKEDGDASVTEY